MVGGLAVKHLTTPGTGLLPGAVTMEADSVTMRRMVIMNLFEYLFANPPFNDSDWPREEDDVRWKFGVPSKGNAKKYSASAIGLSKSNS